MSRNLKAGFPGFSCFKFHKHNVAFRKDVDCWQVSFLEITIFKVKGDMVSDLSSSFSFSWYMYVGLVAQLLK